jgi:putative (di)nucleoside polyphosphate hydrolase
MPSEVFDFPLRADRDPVSPLLVGFERAELDTRQVVLTAGCVALALSVVRMAEAPVTLSLAPDEGGDLRPGIGIGLLDRSGRVLLLQGGDDASTAWRLPQGQFAARETPVEAAERVMREICGLEGIDPITQSFGWLRYGFPDAAASHLFPSPWRGQQQKWVAARFPGSQEVLDRAAERAGLHAWRWAPLDELAALIRPLKTLPLAALVQLFG